MTKRYEFILGVMIVLMYSTVCMETDIYVPAFPVMKDYFLVDDSRIQYVIIYNFIGICIGSLIFGPFSDSFGRLITLRLGLFLFALSSWGCVYFDDYNLFIVSRFMQGLGASAPMVAAFAMLMDKYSTKRVSQICGILNIFIAAIMAASPMLGSILVIYYGWRFNFLLVAILASICFIGSVIFIEESLAKNKMKKFLVKSILKDLIKMFGNIHYVSGNLVGYLMFAIILVFIANLSILLIDYLGIAQEVYGWYQSMIMGSFALTSIFSVWMIGKFGTRITKFIGLLISLFGILLLLVVAKLNLAPIYICATMSLYTVGGTLAMVIYCVEAVGIFPDLKGVASGLSNALRHLSIGLIVGVSAIFFDGSIMPLAYLALGIFVIVIILAYLFEKFPSQDIS